MVKLYCALVGAEGCAFPVEIDEGESVDDLKQAIKKKKPRKITCDTDELQLYLAKKGDAWLTENEVKGVSDTNGLTYLNAMRTEMVDVGLSNEQVVGVDEDDEAAGNGLVHVLVIVPTEDVVVPPSFLPIGPQVDPISCDDLLAFLESEMTNKNAILSNPHILEPNSYDSV